MMKVAFGMCLGIGVCAIWLHVRFLPQQGNIERQAIAAKMNCDARLDAIVKEIVGVM